MKSNGSRHVVLVLDHPVQHFAQSFRYVTQSQRFALSVMYWTENAGGKFDEGFGRHVAWDVDLLSGYPRYQAIGNSAFRKAVSFLRCMRGLDPDLVVCFGWATTIARLTIVWCLLTRTRLIFYGDTTWQASRGRGRELLRRLLLRTVFRLAAGALSTGTFNREFYIHVGMHPSRVFDSVCPIDVASYAAAREERSDESKEVTVIGFAGKLIPRKGVDELIRALGRLALDERWQARIVGEGEERRRLESLAESVGIASRVHFVGFRNTSQMPAELAGCDIVVVPSRIDMRVLVVPEAMAAGAVVIVSSMTAVWGRGDLVEDGVSGRVYRSGDEEDLAKILEELVDNPIARLRLQSEGARRAMGQGPEAFTTGLERALAAIWSVSSVKAPTQS